MQKLVEKGAAQQVQLSQVHLVSPVFVVSKSRGGWRPIIDLRLLNSFLEPPHFKMEGLYMLTEVLKQGWQTAKIYLKDVYLTIPVAREYHCLLSFQVQRGEWIQFQCLPIGLCTTPFVFTKVIKPIVQFLRQLGIHLIIYLDDLLLAASSTTQLLQDLSTVLQLFTALGFLINYPKSIMNPIQKLKFLGFMVDTKTMRIALPLYKIDAIQKEASQLLSAGSIQIRTLAHFIGALVATKPAVPLGPLHFQALQDLTTQTLIHHQNLLANL